MASINSISVKNVKRFRGMEGYAEQGDLYVHNTKIGFWSQDACGSPFDSFESDMIDVEKLKKKMTEGQPKIKLSDSIEVDYTPEMFMIDLLSLKEDERRFKKAVRQGYGGIYVVGRKSFSIPQGWSKEKAEDVLSDAIKEEQDFFKYSEKPAVRRYYTSKYQFIIQKNGRHN